MADEDRSISISIGGDPIEFGVWCERCALPSAITLPLLINGEVTDDSTVTYCEECAELIKQEYVDEEFAEIVEGMR